MAFLQREAYNGPLTWQQVLAQHEPEIDSQGQLVGSWGDAIKSAVEFEQQNPDWTQLGWSDGPAGQVIGYLSERGFENFLEAGSKTEETAKAGNLVIQVPMVAVAAPHQMNMQLPPHLACLAQSQRVEVQEKANLIEAVTAIIGQEVEMANKYKILNDDGSEIFYAVETTNCFVRQAKQCFPDCAPWDVDILYTEAGNSTLTYKMHRDWTCTCCCFNRPVVDMTDMTTGQKVGSIQDPFACCNLTFNINGPDDHAALRAEGGCCQWGLCCPLPCGPCSKVDFPIVDGKTGTNVGHVQKKVPGCCTFCFAPDVDNYKIDFGGVQTPEYKALLMGLSIFIDFRYFNENRNDDQGGVVGGLNSD
jgi:hypothetical protein